MAEQFLDVQTQVMQQYLRRRGVSAHRPPTTAGARSALGGKPPKESQRRRLPMVGEILEHQPRKKLVMRRKLDLREDNYAAHHTVGGRSISKVDPSQHGLPIMPMTFTLEMMMETAAALFPELKPLGVKNVRLSRWLAFDEETPSTIQVSATVLEAVPADKFPQTKRQVLIEVRDLGRDPEARDGDGAAVGTVALGDAFSPPPTVAEFPLANERPCRTDVPTTYNNLFHGELLQGFEAVTRFGDDGIEGTVRTLPRRGLMTSDDSPAFVGDPVLLDVAMHPAVAWHLEQEDQSGRIMLPFELERLELYGPMPAEGLPFRSRTRIVEETHWHYVHVTEIFDQTGRLWGKIDRIKLWRFYLPFHDVNFHGPKDIYFLGDEWPEAAPVAVAPSTDDRPSCCCVRLRELNDLKHPALQLAGAQRNAQPDGVEGVSRSGAPGDKIAQWLFGRAAAKDAVRILQRQRHGERPFMADVEIRADDHGRPVASPRGGKRPDDYPHVSIAHTAGHIAAIAAVGPRVGIDVELVAPREAGFEQIAFDDAERRLLADFADRDEWIARFWCAKEAVGKALGRGMLGGPHGLAVHGANAETGAVEVTLGASLAEEFPELRGVPVSVTTRRENDLVVATTLCEPAGANPPAHARIRRQAGQPPVLPSSAVGL